MQQLTRLSTWKFLIHFGYQPPCDVDWTIAYYTEVPILSVSVQKFLYHLQCNPFLVIHTIIPTILPCCHFLCVQSRGASFWLGWLQTLLVQLNHHQPVRIRARPCTLLPDSNVGILSIKPQASEGRRWGLAALAKLGTEDC